MPPAGGMRIVFMGRRLGHMKNFKGLEKWKIKKILFGFVLLSVVGIIFLSFTTNALVKSKMEDSEKWDATLVQSEQIKQEVKTRSTNAVEVMVGTQVESIRDISLKGSSFRAEFLVWFMWEGEEDLNMLEHFDIYKGEIKNMTVENGSMSRLEVLEDYHEDGVNYQLARCDATIAKYFNTTRFPLDSHQLLINVQSTYPVDQVVFVADTEKSTYDDTIQIAGYQTDDHEVAVRYVRTVNDQSNPALKDKVFIGTELTTSMVINRDGFGLYIKCFIALAGTITWVLISMFIATYHNVDPIRMVPAALFGTVANIMVGANLLPDALQMGLLEYVNIWGIIMILAGALSVIHINHTRSGFKDDAFAASFGKLMFYTMLLFAVVGNLLLPLSAYMF